MEKLRGCVYAVSNCVCLCSIFQDDADETENEDEPSEHMAEDGNEEDQGLKKAATIGTALMVVNSHRALFIL
jgi:hypothetical protein